MFAMVGKGLNSDSKNYDQRKKSQQTSVFSTIFYPCRTFPAHGFSCEEAKWGEALVTGLLDVVK